MIQSLGLALIIAFSTFAFAEESSTTAAGENKTKLSDIVVNKKFEENREITDAKIKADAGSLSKYSLKLNLSYYGPTLGELDAKDQPNPDGSKGSYETSLGGSLGARYRLDPKTTISAGTGIKFIHPFHGVSRTDVNNPYISYDMTNKVNGIQMRNSFGASYITVPVYVQAGEYAGVNYDASFTYDMGSSGYAIGLDTSLAYYLYNRGYEKADKNAQRNNVAFYPTFKYNFSDRVSMNTSLNISFYNPRSRRDEFALLNKTVSQRLGVGYAYSRDVYISPYVNFFPDKLSWDRTTVNVSTSLSML